MSEYDTYDVWYAVNFAESKIYKIELISGYCDRTDAMNFFQEAVSADIVFRTSIFFEKNLLHRNNQGATANKRLQRFKFTEKEDVLVQINIIPPRFKKEVQYYDKL